MAFPVFRLILNFSGQPHVVDVISQFKAIFTDAPYLTLRRNIFCFFFYFPRLELNTWFTTCKKAIRKAEALML